MYTLTLGLDKNITIQKENNIQSVNGYIAVVLREHLPDDFLPPPPIQTSLSESDQGNLVFGRELPRLGARWGDLLFACVSCFCVVPRLVFIYSVYSHSGVPYRVQPAHHPQ